MARRASLPRLTGACQREEHARCGHWLGSGAHGFKRPVSDVLLCECGCHSTCPVVPTDRLGGVGAVEQEQWDRDCTCPGSDRQREVVARVKAQMEARKQRTAAALADADVRPGDSAPVLQAKLARAFEAHGVAYGSDFSRVSRFLAAGVARPGTRAPRLAIESARGLRAARRLGPPDPPGTDNARTLRSMRRSLAVMWTIAGAALAAGRLTRGPVKAACVATGSLLSVVSVAFSLLTYAVSSLLRAANRPDGLRGRR